ncbi:MAG: Transcriptional regulator, GntR family, partial [uncultured Acidimicrobiales bacterium]
DHRDRRSIGGPAVRADRPAGGGARFRRCPPSRQPVATHPPAGERPRPRLGHRRSRLPRAGGSWRRHGEGTPRHDGRRPAGRPRRSAARGPASRPPLRRGIARSGRQPRAVDRCPAGGLCLREASM